MRQMGHLAAVSQGSQCLLTSANIEPIFYTDSNGLIKDGSVYTMDLFV